MFPPSYKTKNYRLVPYQQKDLDRYLEMALDRAVVEYMGGSYRRRYRRNENV
jgi:hypothetical protein